MDPLDVVLHETKGKTGALIRSATPERLVIGAAVLLLIGAAILISAVISADTYKIEPAYAALFSGFVAASGFIFTSAIKLHSENRDRAYELLAATKEKEIYRSAINGAREFLKNKDSITKEDCEIYFNGRSKFGIPLSNKHKSINESINDVLSVCNFYEMLALSIKYNEVYEPLICDYHMGMLTRFYKKINPVFIGYIRGDVAESPYFTNPRPDAFENMEWLTEKWERVLKQHDNIRLGGKISTKRPSPKTYKFARNWWNEERYF